MDIRLTAPPITRVPTNPLPEQLLHRRHKRMRFGETQPAECDVGSRQTTGQRTCVVALWRGNLLLRNFLLPERVDRLRLLDPRGCQMGIGPNHRSIAVLLRPVAVPRWGSVISLRSVMIAFAMAAHVQDFVVDIRAGKEVE